VTETPLAQTYTLIQQFSLRGRLSVRVADRIDTAEIRWVRGTTSESLKVYTPFGNQIAELQVTASGARLIRGDQVEVAPDVATLTERLFGISIDTSHLARWVQGLGLDAASVSKAGGRIWQLEAENIRMLGAGRVAGRITARDGDTVVRLVVDSFEAGEAP
jgi:outer membrane biogenesis lipoprotein LolB